MAARTDGVGPLILFMCGIAGTINFKRRPVALNQLQTMASAMRHRGPDDDGYITNGHVGLAFRRLAIIDLSSHGHQPMTNEDGTVTIVFNGEIYNFLELATRLRRLGHTFRSKTDTEVIIHAYEEYGLDCLNHLKGMFAFAIWDNRQQQLFCARDRFGIKPFYYSLTAHSLTFASEIKPILASRNQAVKIHDQALVEYFTFQNVLSDQTLFDGIKILPAGHRMVVRQNKVNIERYWNPSFQPIKESAIPVLKEEIRHRFEQAIIGHMISDVPVGSHSSGGMDSGAIVAIASRYLPHLMTFTGGFDTTGASGLEMFFDERKDAEIIAREFNTRHYEMVIHAGDMIWIMPKLIWHLEDLRVGMCYQNYYINQLAGKFVKVVLSGTGGDELFGGYPWRYRVIAGERNLNRFHQTLYGYWSRLIPDDQKPEAFTPTAWKRLRHHSARSSYDEIMKDTEALSPVNRALYFEMKTFLHGLLVVEDKVSMAHSIESRVPFLDHDLVDLALSIPPHLKIKHNVGKYIVRQAFKTLLPPAIFRKKKQGFSAPEETWYRGKSYQYVKSILLSKRSLERGIFRRSFIHHVIEHHHRGLKNYRLLIWSLLSFEWWNRIFIDGEKVDTDSRPHA